MIRFIFGFTLGIYVAQNYSIPNVKTQFDKLSKILVEYEQTYKK